jgi:hypothetical protein
MPKVEQVCIQIARPDGDYPGQVSYGFYTVEGKKLTMTDSEGVPVRRRNGGLVQHELRDGENSQSIASVLTRQFRNHLQGDGLRDFGKKLVYPKIGVA